MYPSNSIDNFQEQPPSWAPTAPPYPQLASHLAKTTTINATNYQAFSAPPLNASSSAPKPWSTGLCDCCDDITSCCLTCWCPCVAFGRIAEIVDRGTTSCGVSGLLYGIILCLTGCSCLYSCFYRSKMRGQYFLEESPCTDCCIHCCCEDCSLCQEYRQLTHQGFDMSIGWHGNMARHNRVAAVVEGGMTR